MTMGPSTVKTSKTSTAAATSRLTIRGSKGGSAGGSSNAGPEAILKHIPIVALSELEDLVSSETWKRACLTENSSMFPSFLEEVKGLVEGVNRGRLKDGEKSFNNIFG
jgi:hypothetical protein